MCTAHAVKNIFDDDDDVAKIKILFIIDYDFY